MTTLPPIDLEALRRKIDNAKRTRTVMGVHVTTGRVTVDIDVAEAYLAALERAEELERAARWYTDVSEPDELGDLRAALGDPPPGYVSARLRAERMEAALNEYGDHRPTCLIVGDRYDRQRTCTCGWDEARAVLADPLRDPPATSEPDQSTRPRQWGYGPAPKEAK